MRFVGNKAGVKVDSSITEKINKMTYNSVFGQKNREKFQKLDIKIEEFKTKILDTPKESIEYTKEKIIKKINFLEAKIYAEEENFFLYMDIDMFFAAVEINERPDLADKPVVVGTSIVSAANYVARKYGIRSAMPVFVAKNLCPNLVIVKNHIEKYKKYSKKVYSIIEQYDFNYNYIGMDEACLNLKEYIDKHFEKFAMNCDDKSEFEQMNLFLEHVMKEIKRKIRQETNLTVSLGTAPNYFLAKLASEEKKPDGLYILRKIKQDIYDFLDRKKIRKIPGVGANTEYILQNLGIKNTKDLRKYLYKIHITQSPRLFESLLQKSIGYVENRDRNVKNPSYYKSKTFKATKEMKHLHQVLTECSQQLSRKCTDHNVKIKKISLNVKYQNLDAYSIGSTLANYTDNAQIIYNQAVELLGTYVDKPIRLLGIKVFDFLKQDLTNNNINKLFEEKSRSIEQHSNSLMTNFSRNELSINCPICNKILDFKGNNTALNKHIDDCLKNKYDVEPKKDKVRQSSKKKQRGSKKRSNKIDQVIDITR